MVSLAKNLHRGVEPKGTAGRLWPGRALRVLPLLAASLAGAGLIVRYTVRDRFPAFSLFYYGLSPVIVAALLITAGVIWLWAGKRALCAIAVGEGPFDLRILHWNVARGGPRLGSNHRRYKEGGR